MKKTALVTCDFLPNLIEAEQDLPERLRKFHIDAEPVIWDDDSVDWKQYELIIIRTPWDYFIKLRKFREWLNKMDEMELNIHNNVNVIKWNLHKYYLRDLAEKGIKIVPTVFLDKGCTAYADDVISYNGWERAIIKPAISAAAHETYLVTPDKMKFAQEKIDELLENNDLLVQQFIDSIRYDGEWSLIYFNGKYSHSLRKIPGKDDFRVQKLHGGTYNYDEPSREIIEQAERIIDCEGRNLLYARVDGVVHRKDFFLMELELIEPELFLEHSGKAKENFVNAVSQII